jgi:hypothetical protein
LRDFEALLLPYSKDFIFAYRNALVDKKICDLSIAVPSVEARKLQNARTNLFIK